MAAGGPFCFHIPMSRLLPAILVLLVVAGLASAHPLPNMRFDRTVAVRLTAAGFAVRYTLEMNEWSMVLDGNKLLAKASCNAKPSGEIVSFRALPVKG